MASEFDHLYICVSTGAPEAGALATFGLSEGAPNVHPGQGTACRRFFFSNAYLELLWIADPAEAQTKSVKPTCLWERWTARAKGMCPFGLGFRPSSACEDPPFGAFKYQPSYLPPGLTLFVGTNANRLNEPMLFYLPFALRPNCSPRPKSPVVAHPAGLLAITRLQLAGPHTHRLSPEMSSIMQKGLVQLRKSPEHFVEIGFDGELQGRHADFRPVLPLVFRW